MARERVANTHDCSEREIAELFKNSKAYLNVPFSVRTKVEVTKDLLWEFKCPCFKNPRINECANPIKSNRVFADALANLLSSAVLNIWKGRGGGERQRRGRVRSREEQRGVRQQGDERRSVGEVGGECSGRHESEPLLHWDGGRAAHAAERVLL